jgi:hypothetical protein
MINKFFYRISIIETIFAEIYRLLRRALKITRNVAIALLALIIILVALVNTTPVQNFIAQRAVKMLADKLHTRVAVKHVRIDFLNHVLLQGLYIEDQAHDTLLYAGEARVRITDWFILKKEKPVLTYIGLHDAYAHLYRKANSKTWNYQFVVDAFDTGKKDTTTTKKQNEFELDLEKVDIQRMRFHMDDAWVGSDMDIDVESFAVDADEIDLKKRRIDVNTIAGKGIAFVIREYTGGRPPKPKTALKPKAIDTTAFNQGGWLVNINKVTLENSYFSRDDGARAPYPGEFDASHIRVSDIVFNAERIKVVGDTVTGRINQMGVKERSGLIVKKLSADVRVNPNESVCENLYLETNRSKLQNYYAMRYTRFPDFEDYIDKVVMEVRLSKSYVDSRDIAFFAPALKEYPTLLTLSGKAGGTVDSIVAINLNVTDGQNIVKGNIGMYGLPDINTTWIDYRNGEIFTNGQAIFKYAPQLRNNPNLALEKISHAYFRGNFTGYIENFAANGVLATNLGTIQSNVKMNLPQFSSQRAAYSGTVATQNFNIGALIRQPELGYITIRSGISGRAFDPKVAQININAEIDRLDLHGYSYRNIKAEGILSKNTFNGDLLVDDPNLAMTFKGGVDFNKEQLSINAEAHLLNSDLTALKLLTDTVKFSGDFDLNWTGNTIDNFSGYAKLFNINLLRNGHRLDLDSIYVNSYETGSIKNLAISSNAFTATLKGKYELSTLPYSFQYYISRYLPNYIDAPKNIGAIQDLTFEVTTRQLDSLLAVLPPTLQGFNNSTISGLLNTPEREFRLLAKVPYGKIANFALYNVSVDGTGDLAALNLQANAEHVVLGDSVLNATMQVNTHVSNDSVTFKINTNSQESYGTATLNGQIVARGDSLFLTVLPSEFYLNDAKWELNGGEDIIYSDNYLYVNKLSIKSGLQQIEVNGRGKASGQNLDIKISNLDMALLNSLGNTSDYQPEGRINAAINIDNIFTNTQIGGVVKATDVKLGTDTIGNINVVGNYDIARQVLNLDPISGIYKGNTSISAGGVVSFKAAAHQDLNGFIQLNNADLSMVSPFLQGFVSNISGAVNGKINITGSSDEPNIAGNIQLDDTKFRLDFLGTLYAIHNATISITNTEIDLGNINIYDVHKNTAIITGKITHNKFKDFAFNITGGSSKFEVVNLREDESDVFYGNLIAGFRSITITGPLENINIRILKAIPRDKSHLYLPLGSTSAGSSNYSYVTFKTYGTEQAILPRKKRNKLNINIDASLNELAQITMVLDPITGDAITAQGTGNLSMEIPDDNELRMYGAFDIQSGNYTFTLPSLFFKRVFKLSTGSRITFNGPISSTDLNVEGVYTTRARLSDLLSREEQIRVSNDNYEAQQTRAMQDVNVLLYMKGSLLDPKVSYKIDLANSSAAGTYAYDYLRQTINQDEQQLIEQVASLLLINSFKPRNASADASTGALGNVSDVVSGTVSSQLTNMLSKATGDKSLMLDVNYRPYSYNEVDVNQGSSTTSRNQLSIAARRNFFNDRLTVEVGSSLDWGRATAAGARNNNNFNPLGDFRAQYLLKEDGKLRLNVFRTTSFDVSTISSTGGGNITRNGIGLSWKKTFDSFSEFIHGANYSRNKEQDFVLPNVVPNNSTDTNKRTGTW